MAAILYYFWGLIDEKQVLVSIIPLWSNYEDNIGWWWDLRIYASLQYEEFIDTKNQCDLVLSYMNHPVEYFVKVFLYFETCWCCSRNLE